MRHTRDVDTESQEKKEENLCAIWKVKQTNNEGKYPNKFDLVLKNPTKDSIRRKFEIILSV